MEKEGRRKGEVQEAGRKRVREKKSEGENVRGRKRVREKNSEEEKE